MTSIMNVIRMKAGELRLATPSSRLFLGLVPWYGLLIVLGAALAVFHSDREAKRLLLPKDCILDLALWILPFGIIGARIYYVIFTWPTFRTNPVSVLYLWEGGLAIYGGLIAGAAVLVLFCRKRKLSVLQMLDIIVPGVALAQAIGRWGNYFNQEAFGLPLRDNSPLAFFPLAVLIRNESGSSWHMATFFYESSWDFLVFLFLLWGRRRWFRKRGDVFLFYLMLYSAGRLVIENLRMDSLYLGSSVRISQLLSILILISVLALFWFRKKKEKGCWPRFIIICLSLGLTVFALLLSLTSFYPGWNTPLVQARYLAVYSLIMILFAVFLYGRSDRSEVCYAHHQA